MAYNGTGRIEAMNIPFWAGIVDGDKLYKKVEIKYFPLFLFCFSPGLLTVRGMGFIPERMMMMMMIENSGWDISVYKYHTHGIQKHVFFIFHLLMLSPLSMENFSY